MVQSPLLIPRRLRAKDRMDGMPHEKWPIRRLAEVSEALAFYAGKVGFQVQAAAGMA